MDLPGNLNDPSGEGNVLSQYKIPILLGGVSILSVIIAIILLVRTTQSTDPISFSDIEGDIAGVKTQSITVDIEGGVVQPGVYTLPVNSRVEDAILKAGGLSGDADTETIAKALNRAQILGDGVKLFIPKTNTDTTSHNVDSATRTNVSLDPALLSAAGSGSQNMLIQDGTSVNILVSINTADATSLDSLPGVGPATIAKIIAGRPYGSLEELVSKKAVGKATFAKIQALISL